MKDSDEESQTTNIASLTLQTHHRLAMAHGYTQSYTDGLREAEGHGYTVVSRTTMVQQNYVQESLPPVVHGAWAPRGPDPKGVAFLPMEEWGGIVDGYIFKTAEQGIGYYRNGCPTKNMAQMEEEELLKAAFTEGVPKGGEEDTTESFVVYMDEDEIEAPFGRAKTAPFLELFWRRTGADCDGEEDEMIFPDGKTYTVLLCDTRKN